MAWKIGVKSHASRLIGSAPGWAGVSGGCGVGDGAGLPDAPGAPGAAHAATTSDDEDQEERAEPNRSGGARAVTSARLASGPGHSRPAPGVAAGDPSGAHPAALEEAVLLDGLLRVARAGRLVAAARRQPREHDPVELDQPDPDALHASGPPRRRPCEDPAQRPDQRVMVGLDDRRPGDDEDVPARLERGRHHPERLAESAPDPVPDHGAAELSPGRQSEAGRLEVGPQEPGGEQRVGPGRPAALERREVLRAGEHHEPRRVGPRPSVRPSAAFDRVPVERPGLDGRRSTSSGRGSRVPWRDGASWAGRSASSGLSGILSIRPRGRSCLDPLEARKRAGRPKARGASSSGG